MATSREMTEGRALPLIFNFTLPLLLGNLLQQTYSLVDAAIVGKFLGINALASVGASTSVIFLILGFCNGCCGGFGGAEVRGEGLCYDAPLCGGQSAIGRGNVGGACRGHKRLLCGYSAHDAYTGEYLYRSLLLSACYFYRCSLYFLL